VGVQSGSGPSLAVDWLNIFVPEPSAHSRSGPSLAVDWLNIFVPEPSVDMTGGSFVFPIPAWSRHFGQSPSGASAGSGEPQVGQAGAAGMVASLRE
jgi:hypothetical protein